MDKKKTNKEIESTNEEVEKIKKIKAPKKKN